MKLKPKTHFIVWVLILYAATLSASPRQLDRNSYPIAREILASRIASLPISSPEHQVLIVRAQVSGLSKVAYAAYTQRWHGNEKDAYAKLWLGEAASRYWQDAMSPSYQQEPLDGKQLEAIHRLALDSLQAAQQQMPRSALASMDYGYFLFWLDSQPAGNMAKGLHYLQYAVFLEPKGTAAHALLGDAYAEQTRNAYKPPLAKQELMKAIFLDPADSFAHWRLTQLYVSTGNYEAANQELQIYRTLIPPLRASGQFVKYYQKEIQKHLVSGSKNRLKR